MCDGRNHPLVEVFSDEPAFVGDLDPYHVVRWCPDCGAVVVDLEVDGRLIGRATKMKFPQLAYKHFIGRTKNEERERQTKTS